MQGVAKETSPNNIENKVISIERNISSISNLGNKIEKLDQHSNIKTYLDLENLYSFRKSIRGDGEKISLQVEGKGYL